MGRVGHPAGRAGVSSAARCCATLSRFSNSSGLRAAGADFPRLESWPSDLRFSNSRSPAWQRRFRRRLARRWALCNTFAFFQFTGSSCRGGGMQAPPPERTATALCPAREQETTGTAARRSRDILGRARTGQLDRDEYYARRAQSIFALKGRTSLAVGAAHGTGLSISLESPEGATGARCQATLRRFGRPFRAKRR